jgi:hypothetical protein
MTRTKRLKDLFRREYLPMGATIAMWAVVVAAVGHADTARLLAATVFIRAIQLLTKMSTATSLKQRMGAPPAVRLQARHFAFNLQVVCLTAALLLTVALSEGMKAIGQHQVAAFLPFIALGMPARYLREADVSSVSPNSRLALTICGLAIAAIGWAAGWPLEYFGLAFGLREWAAYAIVRWWPRPVLSPKVDVIEPLRFDEVARRTSIIGRQLLTYRLTKSLLTVFGPFGTAAARTGRGLNLHKKIEPYMPHHFETFVLVSAGLLGGSLFIALRSGEPAAMVGSAGLAQIGAAITNVVLLWRYLPTRGSEAIVDDDDDE